MPRKPGRNFRVWVLEQRVVDEDVPVRGTRLLTLEPGVQRVVQILVTAVAALFLLAFLYLSIKFVLGVDGHIAPALRIPMEIPYASSIVGSALMLYYLLKTFWQDERHRQRSG